MLPANPHPPGSDLHELWEICIRRDVEAFLAQDWELCAADFHEPGFIGIDGRASANPDDWRITFPTLAAYREAWVGQSRDFAGRHYAEDPKVALYAAISLAAVDIDGDTALVHKKFDGSLQRLDGAREPLVWQSLFFARRFEARWKLCGFVGYLPNPMGVAQAP